MKIEFLSPHALNFGEDFEYLATFVKGKGKTKPENIRLLIKGLKTGQEYLLMLEYRDPFFGKSTSNIEYVRVNSDNYKTPDLIKNRQYNYYRLDSNPNHVHEFFSQWKSKDPLIHVGNMIHQFLTEVKGYKGSYKFDSVTY